MWLGGGNIPFFGVGCKETRPPFYPYVDICALERDAAQEGCVCTDAVKVMPKASCSDKVND